MENDLQTKCLKKWFYKILPIFNKNPSHPLLKEMFSSNIKSLGIEGALEELLKLYKKETILVTCSDIKNFIIVGFFDDNRTLALLYKEENGVEIVD